MSVDGCIWAQIDIEFQLLVRVSEVELRKRFDVGKRCENVFNEGKRVCVTRATWLTVVITEPNTAISFHNRNDWGHPY